MADEFADRLAGLGSPAENAAAVTPDDNADLSSVSRGLWIGTGGNVAVILARDSASVVFQNVSSGTLLPVRARRVLTTGTSASNILALR